MRYSVNIFLENKEQEFKEYQEGKETDRADRCGRYLENERN